MDREQQLRAAKNNCIFAGVALLVMVVLLTINSFDSTTAVLSAVVLVLFVINVNHYKTLKSRFGKHKHNNSEQ